MLLMMTMKNLSCSSKVCKLKHRYHHRSHLPLGREVVLRLLPDPFTASHQTMIRLKRKLILAIGRKHRFQNKKRAQGQMLGI